jgi:hypothetical protein
MADGAIKRTPVREADLNAFRGGLKRPGVTTGRADPVKARMARVASGTSMGGMFRNAGMLVDLTPNRPYASGYRLEAYRSSYANGLSDLSGTYDVPTYFVQMNQQNGGVLYWPITMREKYQWYRYWARSDAYVGRALELLADLPMSKLTLNMPKFVPKEVREEIKDFFTWQLEVVRGFELCQQILWELNMIGNVHLFHEWDEQKMMWRKIVMLPPEEVYIFQYPFSENRRVEYRPERLIQLIKGGYEGGAGVSGEASASQLPGTSSACDKNDLPNKILENIPQEIVDMVKNEGCIVMDSDPMTGSFVATLSRRRSPYLDLGASVLERVLIPMLQKEHYRYTQLSLASRNMTPKNLITAPGLMPAEVDELRTQVDLSYMDPEYSIIMNYEVQWQQIGAQDRLLDLSTEYERIENQVFAAMGVTRELLTGEATFSGSKITVEILNTMFLLTREILCDYIERQMFMPICERHHWYSEDKNGARKYWHPRVGFNRLTIRDNAEVFDSLFQLYQKGSLDVDVILELFNLDSEEQAVKLKEQCLTVKDTNFNRLLEEISSETGRKLAENSDVVEKMAKYLGLNFKTSALSQGEGGETGSFGAEEGFGGFGGSGTEPKAESKSETAPAEGGREHSPDEVADAVAEALPEGADQKDVESVVKAL